MKNIIIICGLPGTGKTTLSKMIAENKGYRYISDWEILDNSSRESHAEDRIKISKTLSPEIDNFILANSDQKLVLDLDYTALPEDFSNFKTNALCKIIYLGFGDITFEELYHAMQSKSNSNKSEEQVKYYLEISELCKTQCNEFGYDFFAIGKNRQETIQKIFDEIEI